MSALKEKLASQIDGLRAERKTLMKEHGATVVSEVTIQQLLGGLRGVKGLVCDTSLVTADAGLHIRGHHISELTEELPESIFWLLLTGERPSESELKDLQSEFTKRSAVPQHIWDVLSTMSATAHPMTMLSAAVLALQGESHFASAYAEGTHKNDYWLSCLEDSLDLIAKLPTIGAGIYRMKYNKGERIAPQDGLDWGGNYAHMLGINDSEEFKKMMRLYLTLLIDHEGGNASAFASNVVGSTLTDVYYTVSGGLNTLAGPLHGLAIQECLKFVHEVLEAHNDKVPSDEEITAFCWKTLETGVIPGYGHPVLRVSDPRFVAFYAFGEAHCSGSAEFQVVEKLFRLVPDILTEHGKAKNPWPNVDAVPGSLFNHFGIREFPYMTVFFGVSRAMGYAAQYIMARALGNTIIRPKSVGTDWVKAQVK